MNMETMNVFLVFLFKLFKCPESEEFVNIHFNVSSKLIPIISHLFTSLVYIVSVFCLFFGAAFSSTHNHDPAHHVNLDLEDLL